MKHSDLRSIPDHSRAGIIEAYEAALYSAAFQRMEESEVNHYDLRATERTRANFQRIRRRVRARHARAAVLHALPRLAQAAACLIAVFAIGMGVALAASPAARNWATGILNSTGRQRIEEAADSDSAVFGDPSCGYATDEEFTDAAVYGGALLVCEGGEKIRVQTSTSEEPHVYSWLDQNEREIAMMASGPDAVYLIYKEYDRPGEFGNFGDGFERFGIGTLALHPTGYFTVEACARFDSADYFGKAGVELGRQSFHRAAFGNGKLYFTTLGSAPGDGSFFSATQARLFSWNPETRALEEHHPAQFVSDLPSYFMFYGGNQAFIAFNDQSGTRIYRIEADVSFTRVAEIPTVSACTFAYCAETDTLYYKLDSAIYAAPHFDVNNARIAAVSAEIQGGRALMLDAHTYAIANYARILIYNLDTAPEIEAKFIVGGDTGSSDVDARFCELHPELIVASKHAGMVAQNDADTILDGGSTADIYLMREGRASLSLLDAAYGAAIEDEEILAEVAKMFPGIRARVTRGNELFALPFRISTCSDLRVFSKKWARAGYSEAQIPQTWTELLEFLRDFSLSDDSKNFWVGIGFNAETTPDEFAATLFRQICEAYARGRSVRNEDIDFSDAEFFELMDLFRQIRFDAMRYTPRSEADADYSEWYASECALLCIQQDAAFDFIENQEASPAIYTLRLRREAPIAADSFACYAFINPHTKHLDLALEYLRLLVECERGNALIYDCATPAAQLAVGGIRAEDIEAYRALIGRATVQSWDLSDSYERLTEVGSSYFRGKIGLDGLAGCLNAIFSE